MLDKPLKNFSATKKSSGKFSILYFALIATFVVGVGTAGILFANYIADTSQTTELSKASEIIRCGYVNEQCTKLAPGQFGTQTKEEKRCTTNSNKTDCTEIVPTSTAQPTKVGYVVFDPEDGTKFSEKLNVKLSYDEDKSAEIYYKVNDGKYEKYDSSIELLETSTVSAKAMVNGVSGELSEVTYEKSATGENNGTDDTTEYINYLCDKENGKVKLSWNMGKDYKYYRLVIDFANNGLNAIDPKSLDRDLITQKKEIEIPVIQGEEYKFWGVYPFDNLIEGFEKFDKTKEGFKAGQNFTCGTQDSGLRIFAPQNTNQKTLTITGLHKNGVKVMVNQKATEDTSDVDWSYLIKDLSPGVNKFTVEEESVKVNLEINYCELGDINCDGKIDISDFMYYADISKEFTASNALNSETMLLADLDGPDNKPDGKIDIRDFVKLKEIYSKDSTSE